MTFRARLAGAINAEPHELPGLLAAFVTVFAMFSSYSILRPIRETMGLTSGVETLPALFWGGGGWRACGALVVVVQFATATLALKFWTHRGRAVPMPEAALE